MAGISNMNQKEYSYIKPLKMTEVKIKYNNQLSLNKTASDKQSIRTKLQLKSSDK